MDGTVLIVLILTLWVGSAFVASVLAGLKNRSPSRWFFLTLLFGAIPFVILLFLPTAESEA